MALEHGEAAEFTPEALAAAIGSGRFEDFIARARVALEGNAWPALEDAAVDLHNGGEIDLLKSAAEDLERQVNWAAQGFYGSVLPRLAAETGDMLAAMSAFSQRARGEAIPYFALNAFSEWCDRDVVRADAAMAAIRRGSASSELLVATLLAGTRVAQERYIPLLLEMLSSASAEEAKAAAFVLGNLKPDDLADQAKIVQALMSALETAQDERRAAFFRALLSIGSRSLEDEVVALDAVAAIAQRSSPEIRTAAANTLFMSGNRLSGDLVGAICDLLKPDGTGEAVVIDAIDNAISQLLSGPVSARILDLLNHLLETGAATLAQLDGTAHHLLTDKTGVLDPLVAGWLASGSDELARAAHDLVMTVANDKLLFTLDFSPFALTVEQSAAAARRSISNLILFPDTAASILVSLLRTGPAGAAPLIEAVLFNPLLISYWLGTREYLEGIAPAEKPEIAALIERVIGRLDIYIAAIRKAGVIAELAPSERQRFIYAVRREEEHRKIAKDAAAKSIFADLFHTSVILYGDSAVGEVYRGNGIGTREEFRLGRVEYSHEIPRLDTIDPFGHWYQRVLFSMGESPS